MEAAIAGSIGIAALFALILAQVPIAFAMIIVGVLGYVVVGGGLGPALSFMASEPAYVLSSQDLAAVPLFLLMGTFASVAGFSEDVYVAAAAFLGHRRGGLAYATITGSAAFGAICGSSTATAATFAKIALPEMLQRGYARGFSSGVIAAGGTLKSLIPPSLVMIVYCIVAKTFIFDMFIAAIVPALLTVVLNLAAIAVAVRVNPALAPVSERVAWRERLAAGWKAGPSLILLLGIFIGLYSGIFTVSEAASAAAILSLIFAVLRGRMTWANLTRGMYEAAIVAAMLYMILMAAPIFTYFLNLAHVPETLVHWIEGHHLAPLAVISMLLVIYLILGIFFDEMSSILITLPLVLPIVTSVGYDPLWWGVMCLVQVELAMIHPPMGIIVFLLHSISPQTSMGMIYRGVVPFLIADFAVLVLLTLFPELVLWLPSLLKG
ncbi:MAG TPA: TRAP transporter large permease [Hyphomicrobiales bacterium]|nr:TRAP transporter large permease [Hyphomicrobiales bacterium]